ncbi:TrkA family potassium uptake protein [Vibrio sp. SS-MA-C1-2]|uniref:potassium channel family protein n=1 Tax=Vibrio sp. SS-MA-C1-2 TaxID=2908646 RepID=UPI001F15E20B|nr:TrkA family potassium uptake protein [Vibrio sp. SS-MA-C1-2]UJF18562.1 TrkA family potassium uptake protein [Vibrio sp. SS-MA-C1-2]
MSVEQKQFAVIGLGRFGMALCEELSEQGAEVLAIDLNEDRVKQADEITSQAVVADCSNADVLAELRLDDYDIVMVAIGEDIKASILTTLMLKEAGVNTVWVKAKDRYHHKILSKIGADIIIRPDRDMGVRVARKMLDTRVFEFIDLGNNLSLVELVILKEHSGRRLNQLLCCKKNSACELLGFKRGAELIKEPDMETALEIGDILILAGPNEILNERLKRL